MYIHAGLAMTSAAAVRLRATRRNDDGWGAGRAGKTDKRSLAHKLGSVGVGSLIVSI